MKPAIIVLLVLIFIMFIIIRSRKGENRLAVNELPTGENTVSEALMLPEAQSAIIAIDNHLGRRFYSNPDDMTDHEKLFMYIEELEREVNNGGFWQYFYNSSGEYAMQTVGALKTIGAEHTAGLLSKAIEVFPDSNVPTDRDERIGAIESLGNGVKEEWNDLDDQFQEYQDDIAELLLDFVRQNRDSFR